MFFWKNKELREYGCEDFSDSMNVNPEAQEVIDLVTNLLTPEQLKCLEFNTNDKSYSFKERMIFTYGHMYSFYSLKETKKFVEKIIEDYKNLFEIGIKFDNNEIFMKRLSWLFTNESKQARDKSLQKMINHFKNL